MVHNGRKQRIIAGELSKKSTQVSLCADSLKKGAKGCMEDSYWIKVSFSIPQASSHATRMC